jgi:hypothetical protein
MRILAVLSFVSLAPQAVAQTAFHDAATQSVLSHQVALDDAVLAALLPQHTITTTPSWVFDLKVRDLLIDPKFWFDSCDVGEDIDGDGVVDQCDRCVPSYFDLMLYLEPCPDRVSNAWQELTFDETDVPLCLDLGSWLVQTKLAQYQGPESNDGCPDVPEMETDPPDWNGVVCGPMHPECWFLEPALLVVGGAESGLWDGRSLVRSAEVLPLGPVRP